MLNCIFGIQIKWDFKLKMNSRFCDTCFDDFTNVDMYFRNKNKEAFNAKIEFTVL